MYASALSKITLVAVLALQLNGAQALEVISLGVVDEITTNTRLMENFKARELHDLSQLTIKPPSPSKIRELGDKLSHHKFGPLSLDLKIRNPVNLGANTLTFNLDLVQSCDLLQSGSEARGQLSQDLQGALGELRSLLLLPVHGVESAKNILAIDSVL